MDYQLNLDWQDFLANYWQKRPLLIKGGFTHFIDPISPDELAGLALENEVDSRLVSHQNGRWQVSHGPFESYDHLGESNWSLLVQAVLDQPSLLREIERHQPFRVQPQSRVRFLAERGVQRRWVGIELRQPGGDLVRDGAQRRHATGPCRCGAVEQVGRVEQPGQRAHRWQR